MKIVVQRCSKAKVEVDNKIVGQIDQGLVLLIGFTSIKDKELFDYMIDKIINLRIFDDDNGVMNKSLFDIKGSVLSISQFTLYADCSKGRRPSYKNALGSSDASILYEQFNQKLKQTIPLECGIFGADMNVSLVNNGPVTIILEKEV